MTYIGTYYISHIFMQITFRLFQAYLSHQHTTYIDQFLFIFFILALILFSILFLCLSVLIVWILWGLIRENILLFKNCNKSEFLISLSYLNFKRVKYSMEKQFFGLKVTRNINLVLGYQGASRPSSIFIINIFSLCTL